MTRRPSRLWILPLSVLVALLLGLLPLPAPVQDAPLPQPAPDAPAGRNDTQGTT